MNIERWKIIPEFPNYAISNLGRVKSLPRKNRNARAEWITDDNLEFYGYKVIQIKK